MIKRWIAKRRAAAWKVFRKRWEGVCLQGGIRRAERCGEFKFLPMPPWTMLLRLRPGYRNTWMVIDRFATRWAAKKCADSLVKTPNGVSK